MPFRISSARVFNSSILRHFRSFGELTLYKTIGFCFYAAKLQTNADLKQCQITEENTKFTGTPNESQITGSLIWTNYTINNIVNFLIRFSADKNADITHARQIVPAHNVTHCNRTLLSHRESHFIQQIRLLKKAYSIA